MHHHLLPDNFAGGFPNWRLRILHHVARALGLLVKVEGFPYGATRNLGAPRGYTTGPISAKTLRAAEMPSYTHDISGTAFAGTVHYALNRLAEHLGVETVAAAAGSAVSGRHPRGAST